MIGTVAGVGISGILAVLFGRLTQISGYNVAEIEQLEYVGQMTNVKIGELLYAGILISTLGAVMDVAMSVASTINEIHYRNPDLSRKELFTSGIRVGKDMMGTMSNTLILAFTGSSINTLVFMYVYNYTAVQITNMYSIGIEVNLRMASEAEEAEEKRGRTERREDRSRERNRMTMGRRGNVWRKDRLLCRKKLHRRKAWYKLTRRTRVTARYL